MSATSKFFQQLGATLSNMVAEIGDAAGAVVGSTIHLASVPITVLGDTVEDGVKQTRRSWQKMKARRQAEQKSLIES